MIRNNSSGGALADAGRLALAVQGAQDFLRVLTRLYNVGSNIVELDPATATVEERERLLNEIVSALGKLDGFMEADHREQLNSAITSLFPMGIEADLEARKRKMKAEQVEWFGRSFAAWRANAEKRRQLVRDVARKAVAELHEIATSCDDHEDIRGRLCEVMAKYYRPLSSAETVEDLLNHLDSKK